MICTGTCIFTMCFLQRLFHSLALKLLLLKAFGVNGAEIPVQGSPAGSKATETWQHLLLVIWGLLTAHPETRGFAPS